MILLSLDDNTRITCDDDFRRYSKVIDGLANLCTHNDDDDVLEVPVAVPIDILTRVVEYCFAPPDLKPTFFDDIPLRTLAEIYGAADYLDIADVLDATVTAGENIVKNTSVDDLRTLLQ